MFTGIVETTGKVKRVGSVAGGKRLTIDVGTLVEGCEHGASIAINGVCLTVTGINGSAVDFDVITETLDKTTLGSLAGGDVVNLERSLRAGDRLDGHFVQGHVDGTGTVDRIVKTAEEHVMWIKPQSHLSGYMIPKGSVAIDGVSLTIAAVEGESFSVALIPTTLERTTFSRLSVGDAVNLESDIIARTIVHHLQALSEKGGITLETLKSAGFA